MAAQLQVGDVRYAALNVKLLVQVHLVSLDLRVVLPRLSGGSEG